jgi:O-antigen ligase
MTISMRGGFSLENLHTNTYTAIAGLGFVYCFAEYLHAVKVRRWYLLGYGTFFLIFLIVGTSSGSNIAVAFVLFIVLLMVRITRYYAIPFMLGAAFIVFLSGTASDLIYQILIPGKDIEQVAKLSGRETLWNVYMQMFSDNPYLGLGFAVGARHGDQYGAFYATNAHNGVFDILLGMGLIGLLILLIWYYVVLKEIMLTIRKRLVGSIGALAGLVMISINNMTLSIVLGAHSIVMSVFFIFLAFIVVHIVRNCGQYNDLRRL